MLQKIYRRTQRRKISINLQILLWLLKIKEEEVSTIRFLTEKQSIDFSRLTGIVDDLGPPFASGGGRVGFKWGSGLSKALLRKINKKMIKDAVDDIFPTGDYKYDAEIAAEALVENNPKLFGGKLLDDLNDACKIGCLWFGNRTK